MTVLSFDNFDDMFAEIQRAEARANATTTDAQRSIGYGDHWMQVAEFSGTALLIFGAIATLEATLAAEAEAGSSPEELEDVAVSMKDRFARGYRFGRAYSAACPDGEIGETHVSQMIALTPEQFAYAQLWRWDPRFVTSAPWFADVIQRAMRGE